MRRIFYGLFILIVSVMLLTCSNPIPNLDATCSFGTPSTEFGQVLEKKVSEKFKSVSQQKLFDDPAICDSLIIQGSEVESFMKDENKMKALILHCFKGKGVILVEPTLEDWNLFRGIFALVISEEFREPFKEALDVNEFSEDFNSLIRTLNIEQGSWSEEQFKNLVALGVRGSALAFWNRPENEKAEDSASVNAELSDAVIKWINTETEKAKMTKSEIKSLSKASGVTAADLKEISNAQEFTYSYYVRHRTGAYEYNEKGFLAEVKIRVWAICNMDKKKDYYLIRTEHVCNCQSLSKAELKYVSFRPAIAIWSHVPHRVSPNGFPEFTYSDSQPKTSTGSTTYTEGMSLSVSSNVGFNASGLSGGVSVGVTFSESIGRTIPDVTVAQKLGHDFIWSEGEESDAVFTPFPYWTWKINKPAFQQYAFDSCVIVMHENSDKIYKAGLKTNEYYELEYNTESHSWQFPLIMPSRFKTHYMAGIDYPSGYSITDRGIIRDFLTKSFSNCWGPDMEIYTSLESEKDEVAKRVFDQAMQAFEKNKRSLRSIGMAGDFTFYLQNQLDEDPIVEKTITF